MDEYKLIDFGHKVRERRLAMRLSIRALAELADVSPSYISAIETARNSTTGRAPELSIGVAERILKALDLPPSAHLAMLCGHDRKRDGQDGNHLLLYRLGARRSPLRPILDQLFADSVDQWFCIGDPRGAAEDAADFVCWHWPFGAHPYPSNYLQPERIVDALELELKRHAERVRPQRPGLVIADCSAVMRWVVNPESEVDFETRWAELSGNAMVSALGLAPVANVCVYHHGDIESLSTRIDLLETLLQLIRSHTDVVAIDLEGRIQKGSPAIAAILRECKPGGVTSSGWRSLTSAAAAALAPDR